LWRRENLRVALEVEDKDFDGKKANKLYAFMRKEGRKGGRREAFTNGLLLVGLAAENPDKRKDFMVKL